MAPSRALAFTARFNAVARAKAPFMPARPCLPRASNLRPSLLPLVRGCRAYSSSAVEAPDYLSEAELKIFNMLKDGLQPEKLEVQDISGGCGSMYGIDVVSDHFTGLTVMKQHRLVNKLLGEEIKKWHGVQLKTKAP